MQQVEGKLQQVNVKAPSSFRVHCPLPAAVVAGGGRATELLSLGGGGGRYVPTC